MGWINGALFPVFDFFEKNKWAQWLVGAALVAWIVKMWGDSREARGRKLEKILHQQRQAEERARMVERTSEIVKEERSNADEALAARDSGNAPATFDELSDAHKRLAEGRSGIGGPSGR